MTCPDCGAPFATREACDAAFHEMGIRAAQQPGFAYRRRAFVDAYCLQHPAYVESVKSLAAHLCGLCAAIERPVDARAEHAIWSGLRVAPDAAKPPLLPHKAARTIADAHAARSADEFQRAVDAWLAAVWDAWSAHHELARAWLDHSIAAAQSGRKH